MNKRGESAGDNILFNNLIYMILFILFFLGMFYYVLGFQNGAALLEDFYAKEISRMINAAELGTETEVSLDVTKATEIAFKKGVRRSDIFNFDNVNNKVIVSLRLNGGTSFNFFNDVDVVDWDIKLVSGGIETNRLYFKIVEKQRESE
ncbi:MAG: hypothetical protein IIA87_00455 [Nanoarchaeota archaeon]|nr:hypothetical protein [Nanoarchaeota archaeon]